MTQLLWLALLLPGIACAATRCNLSAVPQQIAAEGAAEPAGVITLDCTGAAPARLIEGALAFTFGRRVANRRVGETLEGPVLEIETGPGLWSAFESRAMLTDTSTVGFDGLQWTASSTGAFTLRVRGVRIEGAAETIQAAVRFYLNERIDVTSPLVTVARGLPALLASAQSTLATRGPAPPDDADFTTMIRLGSPFTAVRLSEGFPAAFMPAANAASQGTRFLFRFAGVPDGVRMLAPDAVTGSTALVPTRSGGFGRAPGTGMLSPIGGRQFVMVRVIDAGIDGQGGRLAVNPMATGEALGRLRAAPVSRGTPYVVYEVVDSDSGRFESVEVPAWVAVPPRFDTPLGESVVRASVLLAPLSENEGSHPSAPVPRFRPVSPASDCDSLGDCGAAWFPKMRLVEPAPLGFTAAAGGPVQVGFAGIRNDGGGLLEWRASVRAAQNAGWLSVDPGGGVQNGGVRYDINPAGLAPGDYQAELAFEHIAPPTGRRDERVYPITLKVTPAPVAPPVPPPSSTPTPVISGVTVGPARLSGPFAPGTLLTITGEEFGEQPSVTAGGLPAQVVTASARELGVVLPENLGMGPTPLVVRSKDKESAPWMLGISHASPVLLFALNENGERNSEATPALRGESLDLYATGFSIEFPVGATIQGNGVSAKAEESGLPGVRIVRVRVPESLPAMQTAATVGTQGVVSHPLDIWIR